MVYKDVFAICCNGKVARKMICFIEQVVGKSHVIECNITKV